MHLALGYECRVYDFGSRGNYWAVDGTAAGSEGAAASMEGVAAPGEELSAATARGELQYVPRAVWWGLEWSRYALNSLWHLEVSPPLLRGYNVQALFEAQMRSLPKPLWKRLKYYRAYTAPGLRAVRLRGYYAQTALDGNKEAYRQFLGAHAARSAAPPETAAGLEPGTFEIPMREYDATTAKRVGEMRGRQESRPRGNDNL